MIFYRLQFSCSKVVVTRWPAPYKCLQNPFLAEEDDKITFLASNEIYTVIASDELNSLGKQKIPPRVRMAEIDA
jgi:hypothetical protein